MHEQGPIQASTWPACWCFHRTSGSAMLMLPTGHISYLTKLQYQVSHDVGVHRQAERVRAELGAIAAGSCGSHAAVLAELGAIAVGSCGSHAAEHSGSQVESG